MQKVTTEDLINYFQNSKKIIELKFLDYNTE